MKLASQCQERGLEIVNVVAVEARPNGIPVLAMRAVVVRVR